MTKFIYDDTNGVMTIDYKNMTLSECYAFYRSVLNTWASVQRFLNDHAVKPEVWEVIKAAHDLIKREKFKLDRYIVNPEGYCFVVKFGVSLVLPTGCSEFPTYTRMARYASAITGQPEHELNGSEWTITQKDNKTVVIDDRGFTKEIQGTVEDYIQNFEI